MVKDLNLLYQMNLEACNPGNSGFWQLKDSVSICICAAFVLIVHPNLGKLLNQQFDCTDGAILLTSRFNKESMKACLRFR